MRLLPVALLAAALVSPSVGHAAITEVLTVDADTFFDLIGTNTPPVDPATITFGISFDPTLGDVFDDTTDITLLGGNVAVDGGLGFDYDSTADALTVGGAGLGGIGITAGTNDTLIVIDNISTAPAFDTFYYTTTAFDDGLFAAAEGSVSVPEPGSLLVLAGVGALAAVRRRRTR